MSEEWRLLKSKFSESKLDELIIELVGIFKKGNPNYGRLMGLLGKDSDVKKVDEKEIHFIKTIERTRGDIKKVEIRLGTQGVKIKIDELHLFVQEMPVIQALKGKLIELYKDVSINIKEHFVITGKDFKIILFANG